MNKPIVNRPTPTTRTLAWCLHLLLLGLLGLAAARAAAPGGPPAGPVAATAAALALLYAPGPLLLSGADVPRRAAGVWLAGLGALWLVLLALTADGVWTAFPLYFLQLHLLPRRTGPAAVAVTAAAAITAFAAHAGHLTPAAVVGPALGAAVAVAVVRGYQALYQESERRRRLIEELTATRAELSAAQHTAGVLAERERLAHEIHDTLAQGLSSIHLLLRAAERALPDPEGTAARHVGQARRAAVDNLAEARRFVAALTPPALDGTTLAGALERLCATTSETSDGHPLDARFRLTGEPVPLPTAHEVALLRIAQSALANTVRHSRARTARITLGHEDGHVTVEVTDDGTGFDPADLPAPGPGRGPGPGREGGGFGLAAMHARMRALGGTLAVGSAPGRGTTLTARLPLTAAGSPAAGAAG